MEFIILLVWQIIRLNNPHKRGYTVTTLVIDRQILPEPLLSFIGAPRVRVECDANRVVLTPEAGADDEYADEYDPELIDPDDYDSETDYINAIPGLAERLIASANAPASEFTPVPRSRYRV